MMGGRVRQGEERERRTQRMTFITAFCLFPHTQLLPGLIDYLTFLFRARRRGCRLSPASRACVYCSRTKLACFSCGDLIHLCNLKLKKRNKICCCKNCSHLRRAIPGVIGIYTLACHLPCPAWLFHSATGLSAGRDLGRMWHFPETVWWEWIMLFRFIMALYFSAGSFLRCPFGPGGETWGGVLKDRQRTYFTAFMRFCSADRLRCSAFCRCKFCRTRRPDKEFKMASVSWYERTSSKSHQAVGNFWVKGDYVENKTVRDLKNDLHLCIRHSFIAQQIWWNSQLTFIKVST